MDVKKIIMVVMCTDPLPGEGEKVFYTYSAESILDVDTESEPVLSFGLYQNYPNPFNPNTVISYQLPVTGNVRLKVYDILGNEIATLVNEEKPAGNYDVSFDASNLSSGVYLYKLQVKDYTELKKMILLR
jgi:hypothetical protein